MSYPALLVSQPTYSFVPDESLLNSIGKERRSEPEIAVFITPHNAMIQPASLEPQTY
jgi:hypothetical protein